MGATRICRLSPSEFQDQLERWAPRRRSASLPLLQFTHPSEYVSGRGIVVLVRRSPLDLRRNDGALGVFPHPPAKRILQCANASLVDFVLLQGAFPSRTAEVALRYSPGLHRALASSSFSHSHGVLSPSAHKTWAATYAGVTSPDCAAPSAFFRPLTPCSAREPSVLRRPALSCRPCFMPTTLLGFPLQRLPLPVARSVFRPRSPSRRLRTTTCRANAAGLDPHPPSEDGRLSSPSGVQVPLGIRSSDQGLLASWLEPILSWVFNSSGCSPRRPWRSHRSSSCPVLSLLPRRDVGEGGTSQFCVAAKLACLFRGCRPS